MVPETRAYLKRCDEQTKWIYFLIEDDDFLERLNTFWDKVCPDIKEQFESQNQNKISWSISYIFLRQNNF